MQDRLYKVNAMMHLQVHLAMYTCNDPPDLLLLIILHLAATSPAPAAYTGHLHLAMPCT